MRLAVTALRRLRPQADASAEVRSPRGSGSGKSEGALAPSGVGRGAAEIWFGQHLLLDGLPYRCSRRAAVLRPPVAARQALECQSPARIAWVGAAGLKTTLALPTIHLETSGASSLSPSQLRCKKKKKKLIRVIRYRGEGEMRRVVPALAGKVRPSAGGACVFCREAASALCVKYA